MNRIVVFFVAGFLFAASRVVLAQDGTLERFCPDAAGTKLARSTVDGSSSVGSSGELSYTYPMGVVAATYSSDRGWMVGAPGMIARDAKWGVPGYTDTDVFTLDGVELVPDTTWGCYHTAVESYRKIEYLNRNRADSYWVVTDKKGTRAKYGATLDSRVERVGRWNDDAQPRVWALNEVRDISNKNLTRYVYDGYSSEGSFYLAKVISGKTAASANGYHASLLLYEDRPDRRTNFREGTKVVDHKRVRWVVEITGCDTNGNGGRVVRAFKIDWTQSALTSKSLISAITPFGSDSSFVGGNVVPGSSLPPVRFTYPSYGELQFGFGTREDWVDSGHEALNIDVSGPTPLLSNEPGPETTLRQTVIDVNGDGLPDRFDRNWDGSTWVATNDRGRGFAPRQSWTLPSDSLSKSRLLVDYEWGKPVNRHQQTYSRLMDLDGDGIADFVYQNGGAASVYLGTGTGFGGVQYWDSDLGWKFILESLYADYPGFPGTIHSDYVDINGDGLPDRISEYQGNILVSLNTGAGFQSAKTWGPDYPAGCAWLNYLRKTCSDIHHVNNQTDYCHSECVQDLVDMNGDGLLDKVQQWAEYGGGFTVSLNNGHGWEPPVIWPGPSDGKNLRDSIGHEHDKNGQYTMLTYRDMIDMNGDGLVDKVVWYDDNGDGDLSRARKIYVYFNTGWSFVGPILWGSSTALAETLVCPKVGYSDQDTSDSYVLTEIYDEIMDVDGDGLPDKIHQLHSSPFHVSRNLVGTKGETLLKEVRDGQGGVLSFTYHRLTRVKHPKYRAGGWVVDSMTVNDGWRTETTRYEYTGGLFDYRTRQDRGFECITTVDPAGNRTEQHFRQDEVFAGLVEKEIVRDASGNIYSYVYNTYTNSSGHGSDYGRPYGWSRPVAGPMVFIRAPKLVQRDTYIVDGTTATDGGKAPAGGQWKRLKTTWLYENPWKYDATEYGDPYRIEGFGEVAADGTDIGADKVKTEYDYICNTVYSWLVIPYWKAVSTTDGQNPSYLSDYYQEYYRYDNGLEVGQWLNYDAATEGRLKAVIRGAGSTWVTDPQYGYDAYGNVKVVRDANGNDTKMTCDSRYGTLAQTVVNAKGQTNSYTYDDCLRMTGSTDPNGVTTLYRYDVFGRKTKEIKAGDSESLPTVAITYRDDLFPRRMVTTTRSGPNATDTLDAYTYRDGLGRIIQTKSRTMDISGNLRWTTSDTWMYHNSSKAVIEKSASYFADSPDFSRSSTPAGETIQKSYYAAGYGRVDESFNPDHSGRTTYHRPLKVEYIDEKLHGYAEMLDGLGRVVEVRRYSDAYPWKALHRRDTYRYSSALGVLLAEVEDANGVGASWSAQYDGLGRKLSERDPDRGSWSFGYDNNGNMTRRTDARGQTVTFEYDSLNRVTRRAYPDGSQVTFLYDRYEDGTASNSLGRLTTVTDPSGKTLFRYDARGRLASETKAVNGASAKSMSYLYDSLDRVVSLAYPDGEVVTNTYAPGGILYSVGTPAAPNKYVRGMAFDAAGRELAMCFGNNCLQEYGYYDAAGNHRLYCSVLLDRTWSGMMNATVYEYDPVGNVSSVASINDPYTQAFTYDNVDRLTAQTYPGFVGGKLSYSYDAIDNIVSKTTDGKPVNYRYNALRPHAVTETSDSYTYSYDANGNMISREKKIQPPNPASSIPFTVQKSEAGAFDDGIRYSFDMATLDANRDGIIDVAVANNLQLRELFLGTGTGRLNKAEAGQFDDQANQSLNIVALDVNGDSKTDLAVGNYTEMNMVFTNSGNGIFTKIEAGDFDDLGTHTTDLLAFDANGDGRMDLAEATYYYSYVYTNNGAGRFSLIDSGDFGKTNSWILALEAFDADGDGDLDLVAGYENKPPALFLNNGTGFFTQAEAGGLDDEAMKPEAFVALDIDGDGDRDLLVANYGYASWLFLNNGRGAFTKVDAGELDDRVHLTRDMVAFDMDRDGDMDLATANHGEACELYRNEGEGRFVKVSTSALDANVQRAYCVRAVDVDRDGVQDLLYGNFEASNTLYLLKPTQALPSLTNDTIVVRAKGTSADGWPTMQLYVGSKLLTNWTVGQTNYLDYAYSAAPQSLGLDGTSVYVRFNNDLFVPSHMHWGRWITQQGIATSRNQWVSGDFNGDRKCDVASVFYDGEFASIDVRISSGSAFTLQRWATRRGAFYAASNWFAGDFNGDGKCDFARARSDTGFKCTLDAYLSTGSGFTTQRWCTQQGTWTGSQFWVTGDFTADGKADVAHIYTCYTAPSNGLPVGVGRIDVYESTGSGFVLKPWSVMYAFPNPAQWVGGDFDKDGKCDLAVIYRVGSEAYWRMDAVPFSRGGAFSYSSFSPWRADEKWQAGDVNGDGMADLIGIFGDSGSASIDAFYSKGVPPGSLLSFDAVRRLGTQQGGFWTSQSWLAGDYTGDKLADLANAFADGANGSIDVHNMILDQDRNLIVDYVKVNNTVIQSEDRNTKYIVGNAQNSTDVRLGQETMFTNSWLQYPPLQDYTRSLSLAAYWRFDEGQGTTLRDSSDNGNHGTIFGGATWVQGKQGYALRFDGVDDYVSSLRMVGIPGGNEPYTIEAWIKPESMGARGIVGWGQYGANSRVNALRLTGSGLVNYWWANDLTVTTSNLLSSWHHVVAVFDGTTRSIYVDGARIGSDSPAAHNAVTQNLEIGRTYFGEYFQGAIDELVIWRRALTPSEITQDFQKDTELRLFTYDADNRLVKIMGKTPADYVYDYAGNRVKKVESGTTTYCFNSHYEEENAVPTKYYYACGQLVAQNKGGVLSFLQLDHMDGISRVMDANGNEVRRIEYLPYGATAVSQGTAPEPKLGYTGQERDGSGLYYYGARYYDPKLGRFISVDAKGDDYCYVGNNPINRMDPNGEFWVQAALAVAGLIMGGTHGNPFDANNWGSHFDWGGAAAGGFAGACGSVNINMTIGPDGQITSVGWGGNYSHTPSQAQSQMLKPRDLASPSRGGREPKIDMNKNKFSYVNETMEWSLVPNEPFSILLPEGWDPDSEAQLKVEISFKVRCLGHSWALKVGGSSDGASFTGSEAQKMGPISVTRDSGNDLKWGTELPMPVSFLSLSSDNPQTFKMGIGPKLAVWKNPIASAEVKAQLVIDNVARVSPQPWFYSPIVNSVIQLDRIANPWKR